MEPKARSRSRGRRYPADPPRIEEIIAVMRQAGATVTGLRIRGLVVVLWRACLRISEALALTEADLEPGHGALLVRRGKGGKRREVGMDDWGWDQLRPWIDRRTAYPVGPLFCVINSPHAGAPWSASGVRVQLRRLAVGAGVRRRFRSPSAAPRTCGRDGTRGRSAQRDPAPARSREPGSDLDLPPGHRQRRGDRGRELPPGADDPGCCSVGAVALFVQSSSDWPRPPEVGRERSGERVSEHRSRLSRPLNRGHGPSGGSRNASRARGCARVTPHT